MSATQRPVFYKPVFGNDNAAHTDVVDIAAFVSPALKLEDAALTAPKKLSEK